MPSIRKAVLSLRPKEEAIQNTLIDPSGLSVKCIIRSTSTWSVEGHFSFDSGRITILINVDASENDTRTRREMISMIISEVRETLRHEIEHAMQAEYLGNRSQGSPVIMPNEESLDFEKDPFGYLTDPREIQAFITGLYKKAKSMRLPFYSVLDGWIRTSSKKLSRSQAAKIREIYMQHAKARYGLDSKT